MATTLYNLFKSMPDGTSFHSEPIVSSDIQFISDTSWIESDDTRRLEQNIFDEIIDLIAGANRFILVDMFLYNDYQGPRPETTRRLSSDLTNALIARKRAKPNIEIIVVSDPVNTIYGGRPSANFEVLEASGIRVVLTDLTRLRDPNPLYSGFWRLLIQPFGNTHAETVPSPLGGGRVSIRSWLTLLNFKANHRKVMIADQGDDWVGFVSSANPHDGSSAHRNSAIRFTGGAVASLLQAENAVLELSGSETVSIEIPRTPDTNGATLEILTEQKIRDQIIASLGMTEAGDTVSLLMFYLSDRSIIDALQASRARGADVRVLLDPNKDAFGFEKNGVPNRSVGHELRDADVSVRWCNTKGEQCHDKLLVIDRRDQSSQVITGSANYTRRNLKNYNLELDVLIDGEPSTPAIADARAHFSQAWSNTNDRSFSVSYEKFADETLWHRLLYRFMEFTGLSSF